MQNCVGPCVDRRISAPVVLIVPRRGPGFRTPAVMYAEPFPGIGFAVEVSMTRIALPTWEGRVSPVFDVAEHLLIVDLDGVSQRRRQSRRLGDAEPLVRAHVLASEEVDVLICGAISRPLEHVLAGAGVEVVSGICGRVDDVLRAFSLSLLTSDTALHLPGCQPAATTISSRSGASRADRAGREERPVTGENRRSGTGAESGATSGSRRGT